MKEAFKRNAKLRKEEIRKDLLAVYGHLRHGKKIVDIYESFKKAGLNKDGDPRLAICRADGKQCFCLKIEDGSAIFSMQRLDRWNRTPRKTYADARLPSGKSPTLSGMLSSSLVMVSKANFLKYLQDTTFFPSFFLISTTLE